MYYGALQLEDTSEEEEERNVLSNWQEKTAGPERLIQVHSCSRNPNEERLLIRALSDENIHTLKNVPASPTIRGLSDENIQSQPASTSLDPDPVPDEHGGFFF